MPETTASSSSAENADSHDVIRVRGARENNLTGIDIDLPKRRLTVFTGVSGSGKSSLVFGTIAAESQRLINETYSAFLRGFMSSQARPEVDVLTGLTTAIVVDQARTGANVRSTVGTATDTGAMLRILFSRLGQPYLGSFNAFSFNVASMSGSGAVAMEKGGKTVKERKSFNVTGGMCVRCEGRGSVTDISAIVDDSLALSEGAITVPGYSGDGWYGRIFSAVVPGDEPTTGLHLADVEQFLGLLDRLIESGKSVIVIEHHQAVMAHADWIIDLGPGAGHDGGSIVFEGTPADLIADRSTLTGQHLAAYIGS